MDESVEIKITLENNQVSVKSSRPVPFEEFLQIVQTAILSGLHAIHEKVPEEHREEAKGELYDVYNIAASRTLEEFAPEIEMRPDLTTQAIFEAEQNILDKYNN